MDSGSSQQKLRLLMGHQLCTLGTSMLTMQARVQLLMEATGGDSAAVAAQVSKGAALVALSDLLLSPSVGAWSDDMGRRFFMLLAPAVTLPMKLAAAFHPSTAVLLVERVLSDALRTLGGTTMAYACLCDLFSGEAHTTALGRLNSAVGLGIVVAPLAATAVMGKKGNPRRAYLASAALALVHFLLGLMLLPETKAALERKAQKPRFQPVWGFTRLFTKSERLRQRTCLFTVHCAVEGKVVQDQVSVLQLASGWATASRSRWTSGLGLAIMIGGQATGSLLRLLGQQRFTALCHLTSCASFMAMRSQAFWTSLALLVLGQQRRSASTSWVLTEAGNTGLGHGAAVGYIASLRSAVDGLAAIVYGAVYRMQARRGRSSDVFLLPAALVLLAELLRTLISRSQATSSIESTERKH